MSGLKPKERTHFGCFGCKMEERYYGTIARRRKAKARKGKNKK